MSRVRALWIAIALAGCDDVWSIDRVEPIGTDAPLYVGCPQDRHDEDGDGFPDACDRCPGIADDQSDADADNVGNACDPSGITQDELALFISFAAPDTGWRALAGVWRTDEDSLIYDSPSLPSYGTILYTGPGLPDPPFVLEYHYSVDTIESQGSVMTALLDADPTGKGITCGFQRHEMPLRDVVRTTNAHAVVGNELEIMTVIPGGYRVIARYDRAAAIHCSIAADDMGTGGATLLSIATPLAQGTLGLRSLRVGVHVHYIAIYKTR
jgi:hypothetical protein